MSRSELRIGTVVAGLGGILLFISMFLSWYSFDLSASGGSDPFGLVDTSQTAWQAFGATDVALLVAATIAVGVALSETGGAAFGWPVARGALLAVAGTVAFLLVAFRAAEPPGSDLSIEIGVWMGLAATAAIALGGYMSMEAFGGGREFEQGASDSGLQRSFAFLAIGLALLVLFGPIRLVPGGALLALGVLTGLGLTIAGVVGVVRRLRGSVTAHRRSGPS